jgi:predicted RND superfamily exporter protein
VTRARGAAVAVLAISCLVMVLGLGRTRLDTGVDTVVPQQSGSFQALQRAQQAFGGDPVIVLLKSQRPGQLLGPDLLPRLLQTEGKLARLSDVAVVYGPATVLNQVAAGAQELLATISGRRDALHDTAAAAAKAGGASPAAAERAGQAAETDFDRRYGALLAQGSMHKTARGLNISSSSRTLPRS